MRLFVYASFCKLQIEFIDPMNVAACSGVAVVNKDLQLLNTMRIYCLPSIFLFVCVFLATSIFIKDSFSCKFLKLSNMYLAIQ